MTPALVAGFHASCSKPPAQQRRELRKGETEEGRRLLESALSYISRYGEGEGTSRIRGLLDRL